MSDFIERRGAGGAESLVGSGAFLDVTVSWAGPRGCAREFAWATGGISCIGSSSLLSLKELTTSSIGCMYKDRLSKEGRKRTMKKWMT
jgi:hypothetical protein